MDKEEILIEALAAEFWFKETEHIPEGRMFAEFIPDGNWQEGGREDIEINLNREDCERVESICNYSELLIYNFYSTVLSILLHKYFHIREVFFVSPHAQFEEEKKGKKLFLFKSLVDGELSFKDLFSNNKEFIVRSLHSSSDPDKIKRDIGIDKLNNIGAFALVMNEEEYDLDGYVPDLLFRIFQSEENTFLRMEISRGSVDRTTFTLFGANFKTLLTRLLQNMYTKIAEIDFRSEEEYRLLREFNKVECYFSLEKSVPELIQERAQANPDQIAIRIGEQSIDYAGLDHCSNQFARYLAEGYGVKADFLVGVMMDRSISMAACILGIWKAGGAYVPIDANYPTDRVRQIIEDSGLGILVTDDSVVVGRIGELSLAIPVINMDQVRAVISELPDAPLDSKAGLHDLAYVMYTSGSTGKPKGVMIEHLGMVNHIGSKVVEMGIGPDSIVAQNATHTFDISVWQLFAGLVAGGTTIIYTQEDVLDPTEFITKLALDRVTVLELVPSYLVEILKVLEEDASATAIGHVKILILNAETLMPSMVKRWFALYPHIPIVNTYGATEVSDDMSHYIMHVCPDTATIPVLKRPIQNFDVCIVDEDMQPVPIGMKGEILLAGPAVGRGYLNDKERTERSFLTGPLPGITNWKRIYRTGDLGRYLSDGTMEFLGRKDTQLKIRGNRIEPGEIEHALMTIGEIKHAMVLANLEQQHLVAYYQADHALKREDIVNVLRKKLPEYMMPQYYVQLERFPVNDNGKIDKSALPDPTLSAGENEVEYVGARNEIEEKMVLIWQEILGVERVGVKDDFFILGGHSIKAMKLLARIHKDFDVKVKLEDVFRTPTLEEISKDIYRKIWIKKGAETKNAELISDDSFII